MEILKKYWKKFVLALAALVAGVGLAVLVFRKHITGELGEYFESEAQARKQAKLKQEQEEAALKRKQEEEIHKLEQETKKKLLQAEEKAKEEQKRLQDLEANSKQAFKEEVGKQLGVKEKKRGRPKRNA